MTSIGEILSLLRETGEQSRADLARMTGLSSAAATKITAKLIEGGYIEERRAEAFSGLGRPPVMLALRPDARLVCGIHLSAGRVGVALADLHLNVVAEDRFEFPLDQAAAEVTAKTIQATNRLIERHGVARQDIIGVGVGVPGRVDTAQRVNTHAVVTGWCDVPFADMFELALGLPVVLQHNATAIALAESWFGAGHRAQSTLHVFMGHGTGGGLAYGFGAQGPARIGGPIELGHIVIDPQSRPCACGGRGCLETVFSEMPLLAVLHSDTVPAEGLIAAVMKTPQWPEIYDAFLRVLATTITLIAPEAVVLGGHLQAAPPEFLAALRHDLFARIMPQQRVSLTIQPTQLGANVGVRGAACAGLQKFFYEAGPERQRVARRPMNA